MISSAKNNTMKKTLSKNMIVNLVLVVLILVAVFAVYKYQMKKYQGLQIQKDYETEKNSVIEVISRLEKKLTSYKRLLFKKEIGSLVNNINEVARNSGVRVNSVSPMPEEQTEYYTKFVVNLNVAVGSYHSLGNFISTLEKSPEIFSADTVSITSQRVTGTEGSNLDVNLIISTLTYKD